MRRLPVLVAVSLVSATLALTLAGCHRNISSSRVPPAVLEALDNIYETSSGVLHNPSVDVRVQQAGAVEITIRGQVISKPEAEGDVWIPVLLVPKLPPYFQIVEPNDSPGISLEAYEFKEGLWCIAAVVQRPSPFPFPPQQGGIVLPEYRDHSDASIVPVSLSQRSETLSVKTNDVRPPSTSRRSLSDQTSGPALQSLNLRIALASPGFAESLPFLIPGGQTGEPVTIAISLPNGASFSSSEVAVDMTTVPGWRDRQNLNSAQSTRPQTLTTIPAPATTTGTTVAATLFAPDAVAWDLSTVTFSPPGFFSRFRPWFIPSAILTALLAVGLLLKFGRGAELNARIQGLHRSRQEAIASIERDLTEATAIFNHSRELFAESELALQWSEMTVAITWRLRRFRGYSSYSTSPR